MVQSSNYPQTPEITSFYTRDSTGCSKSISRKEPCKAYQEEADFIPFSKAFLGRILCALFYQFVDVFSDFFGFDHGRVAAIWLAIVVHKKFLKVPCYIVVSDRRPFDLIEIINKVVRRWTSVLSKGKQATVRLLQLHCQVFKELQHYVPRVSLPFASVGEKQ